MIKKHIGWLSDFNNLIPQKIKEELKRSFERINVLNSRSLEDFAYKFLKKKIEFESIVIWFTPKPQKFKGDEKITFFQNYSVFINRDEINVKNKGKIILALKISEKNSKRMETINKSGEGFSVIKNVFRELIY